MADTEKHLAAFADYVVLCYHEARNVRFLVQDGHVDATPYRRLLMIAHNPNTAWEQLQAARALARKAPSPSSAEAVFSGKFGVSLNDLEALFRNPNWKHAIAYGGNAWADITTAVIALRESIGRGDEEGATRLLRELAGIRHNNDLLRNKLRSLDTALNHNS